MNEPAYLTVLIAMLGGAIRVSTPFMFVSLGECLTEKSGRVNLGLEGTLVLGAMVAYAGSYHTGNPWIGVLAAGVAGSLLGAMHGSICGLPRVNDVAVGIAMMLFGVGVAFFFGKPYIQPEAPRLASIPLGFWSGSPSLKSALQVNPLFFIGIALALVMAWALRNTRWGLVVRTVGDSAAAARAMGISVNFVRLHDDDGRRLRRRRRRSVSVAFLSRLLEPGLELRAGPYGGGARHLRALGPAALHRRRAPVRRRGRDRSFAAVDRRHPGLLFLQRRALHPDARHHDRHVERQAFGPRHAGRTVDREVTAKGGRMGKGAGRAMLKERRR